MYDQYTHKHVISGTPCVSNIIFLPNPDLLYLQNLVFLLQIWRHLSIQRTTPRTPLLSGCRPGWDDTTWWHFRGTPYLSCRSRSCWPPPLSTILVGKIVNLERTINSLFLIVRASYTRKGGYFCKRFCKCFLEFHSCTARKLSENCLQNLLPK